MINFCGRAEIKNLSHGTRWFLHFYTLAIISAQISTHKWRKKREKCRSALNKGGKKGRWIGYWSTCWSLPPHSTEKAAWSQSSWQYLQAASPPSSTRNRTRRAFFRHQWRSLPRGFALQVNSSTYPAGIPFAVQYAAYLPWTKQVYCVAISRG